MTTKARATHPITKFFRSPLPYLALLLVVCLVAWYPVLNFWFLKAFEASWLHDALPYTLSRLIRTHAFLYWLDWRIFGWNPAGWYGTALLLHFGATVILFQLVSALTKNRLMALASALIFVANSAYNDVLTWGSFNSYYPLLLSFMLLAVFCFHKYRETEKTAFWYGSMLFVALGLYTRETGLLIVPLLSLFDLLTAGDLRKGKTWLGIIKRQWPYYVIVFLFLYLRSHYGGTIGDTVDSNVKMQMRLLHDKLYLEYAKVTLLSFGKIIPPILVPYPWLNEWRAQLMEQGNSQWLLSNFFPVLGYIGYSVVTVILLFFYRHKAIFRYLLFFWLWVGAFSLFIALAVPDVPEVLIRPYQIITMRYRYFAFAGASIVFGLVIGVLYQWLSKVKRLPALAPVVIGILLIGLVGFNLKLLRTIQTEAYATLYKAQKEFHTQFRKDFPTLPKSVAFYIYPHTSGLNDFLFEWYLIKDTHYPNLVGEPYRIESQVEAVIDKVSRHKIKLSDVFFLDYDPTAGLVNKTQAVREAILNHVAKPLTLNKLNSNQYTVPTFEGPVVELPTLMTLKVAAGYQPQAGAGAKPNSQQFRALVDYAVDRKAYLDTVKFTTCRTISQRDDEPFYYYAPSHLVDGNTGRRSAWIADANPAWVQAELPQVQSVQGVTWGAVDGARMPASYNLQVSADGQNWETVKSIKNNSNINGVLPFDKPVKAKFVKMNIETTVSGDFAQLDEFEVLTSKSLPALTRYTDRDNLLNDSRNLYQFAASAEDIAYAKAHGLDFAWAKLAWETDIDSVYRTSQYLYFPYQLTGSEQTVSVKLPEAEIYAAVGQLLKKHYSSFNLDFGTGPIEVQWIEASLTPQYTLDEEARGN